MSVFFVATSVIKDMAKFKEYGAAAGPTVAAFGGKLVIKGMADRALVGNHGYDAIGIIRFPDMDSLNNWYSSDAYQAIIPLRNEACDMTLVTHNEPA